MFTSCVIVGRLGRDPEKKATVNGTAMCTFSVAVNQRQGEKAETDWFDVVAFGQTAEFAGKYLGKGRLVCVDGRLETYTTTDPEGNKRVRVQIVANRVQSLDRAPESAAPTVEAPVEDDGDVFGE